MVMNRSTVLSGTSGMVGVEEPVATSTSPLGNIAIVVAVRGEFMVPADVHNPVAGSYTSEVFVVFVPSSPPATRKRPSPSKTPTGGPPKATVRGPVAVHVLVAGSYSSAVAVGAPVGPDPPATKTLPLASRTAVGEKRGVINEPALAQVFVVGLYTSAVPMTIEEAVVPDKPLADKTFPSAKSTVPPRECDETGYGGELQVLVVGS